MAVNTLIQVRRGILTDWNTANPSLAAGEIGLVTDTGKFKIGNGSTVWDSLPYAAVLPSELEGLVETIIGLNIVGGPGISVTPSSGSAVVVSLSDPTIQVANITDLTASAAEINLLDGVTATTTELNYVDVTTIGTAQASKAVILDANKDISGIRHLTLEGNLIVNGTTTTVNSTAVTLDDPILTLGGDTAPASDDSKDRGVEFRWHNGTVAKTGFFGFDDSTGKFTFIPDSTNTSEVFGGTTGEIDAKIDWTNVNNKPDPVVTVTLTGDVTGTATATLTDLASGTASVATTIAANSVALGTDTTGNYVTSITNGSFITGADGGGEGSTLTLAVDATSANTASKVVSRDASGNFSAGTITAALPGNASTASTLQTTRAIALSGDVTGTVNFNGSADVTITTTIAANSVALGTDTTGNYVASVSTSSGITGGAAGSEGAAISLSLDVNGLTAESAIADTDSFVFYDASATANRKATADNIRDYVLGGVSGDITVSSTGVATIAANSVALGTDTTGNYVASITNGNYITGGDGGTEGAGLTLAVDATSANTASKVVARDATGNFSAGTITANLNGTATNADKLYITGINLGNSTETNFIPFVNTTASHQSCYGSSTLIFDSVNHILKGSSSGLPMTQLQYFKIDGGTP